ncbi:MAG: Membrane protein related to metalloendopeptidase [Gemmatimonadetes bacterium]|nr:Membrane protein related to metalloendopeptidase [Gemmatimonadota bacterium]
MPSPRSVATLLLAVACGGAGAGATADTSQSAGDTAVGIEAPADIAAVEPVSAAARADSAPITASQVELDALASAMIIPVQGVQSSALHDAYAEARGGRVHEAIDILAPRGTPVLSAADGKLMKVHESVAGGHMVYAADASDRFVLMYGHLERYADGLQPGMALRQGQVIGYVGTSGNANANTPHLHFAIARGRPSVAWWRGTAVNPYPLLHR